MNEKQEREKPEAMPPAHGFLSNGTYVSGLLLAKALCKDGLVNGKDDYHRDTTRYDGGHDVADAIRYVERCRHRVPDAGEEVHDEEHAQSTSEVAENLRDHRTLAAEGNIPLQREVDALTNNDGGEIGKGKGKASICQAVPNHGQGERHVKHLYFDARPCPGHIANDVVEKPRKEG